MSDNQDNLNTQNYDNDTKNQIQKQQDLIALINLKHETSKIRIKNISESIINVIYVIGKILLLLLLGLSIIGIVVFICWSLWLYYKGNNNTAFIVMTIMQVLTGLISVAVGIWALVLAIRAEYKQSISKERLNIVVSPTNPNIVGVTNENDVNPNSL